MILYRVTLSSPEAITEIEQRLADGRKVRVPLRTRNLELEIVLECYELLSSHINNISEYMQILRMIQIVKSINDNVKFIDFPKFGIESLIRGFSLMAGKRPINWINAVDFWKQIEKPEQVQNDAPVQELKNDQPDPPQKW
jgi:hypothetical protein